MADRLLLESGAPDGYLLEDGSGVLLQDAHYVVSNLNDTTVTDLGGGLYEVLNVTDGVTGHAITEEGATAGFDLTITPLANVQLARFGLTTNPIGGPGLTHEWRVSSGSVYRYKNGALQDVQAYTSNFGFSRSGSTLTYEVDGVSVGSETDSATYYFDSYLVDDSNFRVFMERIVVATNTYTAPVSGGLVFAGAVTGIRIRKPAPSGGLVFAGAATLARTRVPVPSGGVTLAGSPALKKVRAPVVSGGLVFGGTATTRLTRQYIAPVSGGLTFSGTATASRTRKPVPSGGVQFAGTAGIVKTKIAPVSGGLVFGGTASRKRVRIPVPSGGITFAGTAAPKRVRVPVPAGGVQFGGAATYSVENGSVVYTAPVSGGLAFAGQADHATVKAPQPSGGVQFGGAATTSLVANSSNVITYVPSGGIQFAGEAVVSFVAVVITPRRRVTIRLGDQGQSGGSGRAYASGSGRSYRSGLGRSSSRGSGRSYSSRRGR